MNPTHQLSQNDRSMIAILRKSDALTVGELTELMGVTATAVRQRLNRLMAIGLIERSRTVEGRGRPSHRYSLTDRGQTSSANNLGDLAVVLWEEVQRIPDPATRQRVISGAIHRLAEKYESETQGSTPTEKMESIVQLFAERQIPISFEVNDGLPVISVAGCPYPTLAKESRDICDMEKELLSKIVGLPIDRCQCQQDGDDCCSFQTAQLTHADANRDSSESNEN